MNASAPRRRLLSDNVSVALGTGLSRVTGFARILALAWVLIPHSGDGRLADVYNLANTAPNIIYDLVIGGALTATLVPRFTRAIAENDDRAINAIVTVSLSALAVLTVVATLAAPLIVRFYTSLSSQAIAHQYNGVATSLAYLFLPQIFFYGATTVLSALLNARGRFFAAAWAPVLTNVVTIVGLVYVARAYGDVTIEHADMSSGLRLALGLGATLGVAAMAVVLVPAMSASGARLRFVPMFSHPAVREVMRLSSWTFGYVIANQVSLAIITVIALRHSGDFTAYATMYILLQLPHGLLAVTLMTTYTPRLTRAHVAENVVLFRTLLRAGLRTIVGLLLPAAILFVIAPRNSASLTAGFSTLASSPGVLRGFGVGLIAFSVYLFVLRGFYAMGDTRTPFVINVVQNVANIVLAVALAARWDAVGLAWAFSISYIGAALLAWVRLDRAVRGGLRAELLVPGLFRAFVAAVPMAIAVWATTGAMRSDTATRGVIGLVAATITGGACYFATLAALGGMIVRRPAPPGRRR